MVAVEPGVPCHGVLDEQLREFCHDGRYRASLAGSALSMFSIGKDSAVDSRPVNNAVTTGSQS
jgi:hypothetical protein